jgi:hypothetical protein
MTLFEKSQTERVRVGNIYYKHSGVLEYIEKHPEWYGISISNIVDTMNMTNLTFGNDSDAIWLYDEDVRTLVYKLPSRNIDFTMSNIDIIHPTRGEVWNRDDLDSEGNVMNNTFFIHREMNHLMLVLNSTGTIL